jgi:hypothetical protein
MESADFRQLRAAQKSLGVADGYNEIRGRMVHSIDVYGGRL